MWLPLGQFNLSTSKKTIKYLLSYSNGSRVNVYYLLNFQLNILPLIWSRDGPLFFSSLVKGIQFQSQLTVSRYPTNKCQINIENGWSRWGAKGLLWLKFILTILWNSHEYKILEADVQSKIRLKTIRWWTPLNLF